MKIPWHETDFQKETLWLGRGDFKKISQIILDINMNTCVTITRTMVPGTIHMSHNIWQSSAQILHLV